MEFIIVYCLLEGPFIYYSKPRFEYEENVNDTYHGYVGATQYIGTYWGTFVTLFGLVIASKIHGHISTYTYILYNILLVIYGTPSIKYRIKNIMDWEGNQGFSWKGKKEEGWK